MAESRAMYVCVYHVVLDSLFGGGARKPRTGELL